MDVQVSLICCKESRTCLCNSVFSSSFRLSVCRRAKRALCSNVSRLILALVAQINTVVTIPARAVMTPNKIVVMSMLPFSTARIKFNILMFSVDFHFTICDPFIVNDIYNLVERHHNNTIFSFIQI